MSEPLSPEILTRLRQSAADGNAHDRLHLHLLERVEALEQRPIPGFVELAAPTPEPAPVATDEELRSLWVNRPNVPNSATAVLCACCDLGRQHGAAPPAALSDALISAESALSDIAEGEETNAAPNTFKWAKQRCAEALAIIRPVMQQHWDPHIGIPPAAQPAPVATPMPDGYAYRYPGILGGIEFSGGREINGSRPIEAIPYWLGVPPAAQPAPPTAPAGGGLVERVCGEMTGDYPSIDLSPAAIREVAEWVREQSIFDRPEVWAERLRQEADQ